MELISTSDVIFLKLVAATSVLYGIRHYFPGTQKAPIEALIPTIQLPGKQKQSISFAPTRSIKKALYQTGKQCIIFYGSQTGTAEKLALRVSKEAKIRFGLESLVATLDDFDYDDLHSFPKDMVAFFIMATYGEGEPTDNAIAFDRYCRENISKQDAMISDSLSSLQYAAFGVGNSSYQHFNSMIKRVDSTLIKAGAQRIGVVGLGDDGKGTLEAEFLAWQASTLPLLATRLGLTERPYFFEATFDVKEINTAPTEDSFLGEPNTAHLRGKFRGPYTAKNPFVAPISDTRQLFTSGDRSCLHIEFNIGKSTLRYETGDHLAVRPVNSDLEVERFLRVFGLSRRKQHEIEIRSNDPTIKVPIPERTTYEAVARYYLDICAPVSRHFLNILKTFAPDETASSNLARLANDSAAFQTEITNLRLNVAQLLESAGRPNTSWACVPFSLLLENVGKLQPRFYSISSSSMTSKNVISITAVVEAQNKANWPFEFKGVASNYLLALSRNKYLENTDNAARQSLASTHQIAGPRGTYNEPKALIYVRPSRFRLPKAASTPVLMIGPGTGVAPFRAFVQERAMISSQGQTPVGRTMLFYGCRREDEDFVYKKEWEELEKSFKPSTFSIHVAFSRQYEQKVYVQDLLRGNASEVRRLIKTEEAQVYVCGDAHRMAKDVFATMSQIIADSDDFGGDMSAAKQYLTGLKECGRWVEDVW